MGLAATQTRFLSLTAKKSNIEYQGQQINQQRMSLSNKSAACYSQMLALKVPTPPTTAEFIVVQYQFTTSDGITYQTTNVDKSKNSATAVNIADAARTINIDLTSAVSDTKTSRYQTFNVVNPNTSNTEEVALSVVEQVNNAAYEDAYNQYVYEQYLYEQQMDTINAKTATIQQQDKTLELQLNQLDTEQNAIKTELDAMDKVIKDNIDKTFKTFGG